MAPIPTLEELRATAEAMGIPTEDIVAFVLKQQEVYRERDRLEREERAIERDRAREREEMEREERALDREREREKERRESEREERRMAFEREQMAENRDRHGADQSNLSNAPTVSSNSIKLPYYRDGDDIVAYLDRFELLAETAQLDRNSYPSHLISLLSGKALSISHTLSRDDRRNYEALKQGLLAGFHKSAESYREEFRQSRMRTGETASQFIVALGKSFDNWINHSNVEETFEGLRNFCLLDQFMSACPPVLRTHLKELGAKTLNRVIQVTDDWLCAHRGALRDSSKLEKSKSSVAAKVHKQDVNFAPRGRPGNPPFHSDLNRPKKCYICGSEGHLARFCRKNPSAGPQKPLPTHFNPDQFKVNFALESRSVPSQYMCSGTVNGTPTSTILRDTGCTGIIVSPKLLPHAEPIGTITLEDYLGREDRFPKVRCFINCDYLTGWVSAAYAPIKRCAVLLGNYGDESGVDIGGTNLHKRDQSKDKNCTETVHAVTRSQSKPQRLQPLKVPDLKLPLTDAAEVRREQQSCPRVDKIRDLTNTGDYEIDRGGRKFQYKLNNGLIVRRRVNDSQYTNGLENDSVVVVPTKCRLSVLKLAHESPLAGHFGHRKTELKIKRDFFWPGMTKDIRSFCRSCDKCQRMTPKGRVSKVPLEPMPIITTPFSRVAIDLVGPMSPPSAEGHRYILTLIDFATGFPEGIPLKEITSIAVAEALIQIFSRVGIPREILSDHGTQFTSELMGELYKLLGVKPLFSSVYHPMGNGRIERLHSTLKAGLKKLCSERPTDWHRYLIPTLFALREIPNDRTGFSPFELLYGRQCRGPLAVLRDLWDCSDLNEEQRSLYNYVIQLQDQLEECAQIAAQNSAMSVSRYKTYFDIKSQNRQLREGDEVLLLLPKKSNKLLVEWQGPYPVVEKRSRLNYVIDQKGTRKVYHINLLKKYVRRAKTGKAEVSDTTTDLDDDTTGEVFSVCHAAFIEETGECLGEIECDVTNSPEGESLNHVGDVTICPGLSNKQKSEAMCMLKEYPDVLTPNPGCTNALEHNITVTSPIPTRAKHYPVPCHLKTDFNKEVDSLIEQGFIVPSNSPYSSPPLLLRKEDGSIRLCVDFRELNGITEFDAEPPCIIEEELDKFHNAKYFTELDIAKAYYQIKLTDRSRKFTAFPTYRGLMEWTRMPFGLVTAVASYIRLMRIVLNGVQNVAFYFDNIFIYSETWESHMTTVRTVLDKLREHGLTAKPKKCNVGFDTIDYLGFRVGKGVICTQESKVERLLKFERPESKRLLRSFLGLFSFYRKFVKNPAELSSSLNQMLKGKSEKLEWTKQAELDFENIKIALASKPILKLPDPTKTFILRTDASAVGLGCILLQYTDDVAYPVAYAGRTLSPAERNYSTIERECLAIVWAIEKFKYYLVGQKFHLEVDHKPLVYLNKFKGSNPRLMRWALALQSYRFTLVHIAGRDNIGADLLSRLNLKP